MNYLTEIKLFYDWLETYPLSSSAIVLWHGLMFVANRHGWPKEFSAPISLLVLRTNLSRSTIYRERIRLQRAGRISFHAQGGSVDSIYTILPLEFELSSHREPQTENIVRIASLYDTQNSKEDIFVSRILSRTGRIRPRSSYGRHDLPSVPTARAASAR